MRANVRARVDVHPREYVEAGGEGSENAAKERQGVPREERLRYLWKLKSLSDKYSRETTYETLKFNLEFD